MATATAPLPDAPPTPPTPFATVADLLESLGGVSAERVRMTPMPGTATEQDIFIARAADGALCELIDGVLVEKVMAYRESLLAMAIAALLRAFVKPRRLGIVLGPDGTVRLLGGRIRMPDVSFVAWDRLPDRRLPNTRVLDAAPNLAVEVISESNTRMELAQKRRDLFAAGTLLVWQIDPRTRSAEAFTSPNEPTTFDATQTLDAGAALPGFTLSLADLFAELDEVGPAAK